MGSNEYRGTAWAIALATVPLLTSGAGCDCGGGSDTAAGGGAGHGGAGAAGGTNPIPEPGECDWEPGERPTAELPPAHANQYVIDLDVWAISNNEGDPVETRTRMNEAIVWATDNGFDKVVVPAGNYLVGEPINDIYAAGIELQGDMTFELASGAVIKMAPNDRWNYCVISVNDHSNVTIRGGEIVGDRADHVYAGGAHDEGHGICAWTSVDHVLIEDMELHELTGDGVLVLGSPGSDDAQEAP